MFERRQEVRLRNHSVLVVVRGPEDDPCVAHQQDLPFLLCPFGGRVQEYPGDNIHHREEREEHVAQEGQQARGKIHLIQRLRHVFPIHSPGDRLQQGQHRGPHGAEAGVQCWIGDLTALTQSKLVLPDGLRKIHRPKVRDQEERRDGPEKSSPAPSDGVHDNAEVLHETEELDDTDDAADSQQLQQAQQADAAPNGRVQQKRPAQQLQRLQYDDEGVEGVPPRGWIVSSVGERSSKEPDATDVEAEQQLGDESNEE
mmetsp:Transcript_10010/g.26579  ORF Transcript_10010/g.26579 Transcript_10010/m.26579 type:complete len:256 (+) Transcript_10010:601-1368(+)